MAAQLYSNEPRSNSRLSIDYELIAKQRGQEKYKKIKIKSKPGDLESDCSSPVSLATSFALRSTTSNKSDESGPQKEHVRVGKQQQEEKEPSRASLHTLQWNNSPSLSTRQKTIKERNKMHTLN